VQRVIFELSRLATGPTGAGPMADAPLALGGTLEGDPYRLSTMLCEAMLRESGWRAESLGSSIPIPSLIEAIAKLKPKLCWISISHIADLEALVAGLNELHRATSSAGIALAIGGRAVDDALCERIRYSVRCGSLTSLYAFAETLRDNVGEKKAKKKRPS
jgi:methanogenic corrinoid protein MtbC1